MVKTVNSSLENQSVGESSSSVQEQGKMGQRSVRQESKQYIPHMWLQVPDRELSPQEKSAYKAIKWISASADRMNQEGVFRLSGAREAEAKLNASIANGTLDLTNVSSNDKHSVICALKSHFVKGDFNVMPEGFNEEDFNRLTELVKRANDPRMSESLREESKAQVIEFLREILKDNVIAKNYLLLNQEVSRFSETNKMHTDNLGKILTPVLIKGFSETVKDPIKQVALYSNNALARFMIEHAEEICLPEKVESSSSESSIPTPPSSPDILAQTPPDSPEFINPADPKGKEKAVEAPVQSIPQKMESKKAMFIDTARKLLEQKKKMLKEPNCLQHESEYCHLFDNADKEFVGMLISQRAQLLPNLPKDVADQIALYKIMTIMASLPN